MKRLIQTAIILMSTLGFWGFVYPELSMINTKQEAETENKAFSMLLTDCEEPVLTIRQGNSKVRIKSKAIEYLYQIKDKEIREKEQNNDE